LRPGWTAFVDAETGLRGSLPSSWHRGPASLNPNIVSPRQIFTVATFKPRRAPGTCGYLHRKEIRQVGSRGAFVTLFVGTGDPGSLSDARPRPESFGTWRPRPKGFSFWLSAAGKTPPVRHNRQALISFKEGGRSFTAGVVIGSDAPPAVGRDAMLILDRLDLGSLRLRS
jgi:hypothetical protein